MIFIKNILKICFVIIGTIIGAGFASGKEIYSFFCIYGIYGFFGLLISNFLIGLVIYVILLFVFKNNIKSYSEFIKYLVGNRPILNYYINNIMNIFLLVSFVIMVSGFGAYFLQELNLPKIFGSIIIAIFAFITFFKNIDGIIKVNSFLIPFLIILIIILGVKNGFLVNSNHLNSASRGYGLIKSILYASYNSIVLIPIIISLNKYIFEKKQIKLITCLTVFFMIIMSIIIFSILYMNITLISNIDIPVVYIASSFGLVFKYLYGFVILTAIFTTAISSGYSFLENISKNKKQYIYFNIFMCVTAVLCSNLGFSFLLNLLYPILGYLGLFQIVLIMLKIR